MSNKGIVYLIGAGPGDPELLTLKGKKILEIAEVIVYDRLVSDAVLTFANPEAEFIYVGKVSGKHALAQDEINALLVKKAGENKIVARLKGGDPYLFGRGGEEAAFIKDHGHKFEVVPGITSALAVPAYAGIPVTHRDATSSFAVITGHEKPGKNESSIKWKEIAKGIGTLVFLMGVENLEFICEQLVKNGRSTDTPVALIRWGTLPEQEVLTGKLDNIVEKVNRLQFKPPAVIVVGEVVNLREKLNWVENRPLWGKKILVTRARAQASQLVEKIRHLGGQPIEYPTIKIVREEMLQPLYNAFNNINHYNWIIFTSVNSVEIFFDEMLKCGMDIRDLKGIKICAIGPATENMITSRGLRVNVVPDEYRAEGILKQLSQEIEPGQWILLPRARDSRQILPETIRRWGASVNEVYLYRAVTARQPSITTEELIINGQVDYITFTSSSTVSNFVKMLGKENVARFDKQVRVACIGPVTADTARENGFTVDIIPGEYTINALLDAIVEEVQMGSDY